MLSLRLYGIHQNRDLVFYRLDLWADNHTEVMLIELYYANGSIVLQSLYVNKRHIFY